MASTLYFARTKFSKVLLYIPATPVLPYVLFLPALALKKAAPGVIAKGGLAFLVVIESPIPPILELADRRLLIKFFFEL